MSGFSKAFNNSRHLMKSGISYDLPGLKWIILAHDSSFSAPTTDTYVLPSLRNLCCLREVNISFCNLSQVPDAIEGLHWLERLDLGGNSFATLPSLRKLSKLEYLNLQPCKLLESLPQLPFPIEWDHRELHPQLIKGLHIFNCPKLGERERCSSMTFSWMIQFIQANPQYSDKIHIITPGSEIPSWINNQSVGASISIDESPIMHDNNNNIIGFLCCAVFSMAPQYSTLINVNPSWVQIAGANVMIYLFIEGLITTKSSHLWIIYFPRESYHKLGKIRFKIIGDECLGMEVKSCGYCWVGKQDLQEFNLTTMNHENFLVQKCKILAIEDETQPQPQSVQESFISQVTETEVSVEGPDSPVAYEVYTESP